MSVTSVNIELLLRVILFITYSQYMKKLSMTVTNVILELLIWVMLHFTYSQFIKELGMSVTSVKRVATEGNLIFYIQLVH